MSISIRFLFGFIFLFLTASILSAQEEQEETNKTKREKRLSARDLSDSLFMTKPYPYILPILGDKAHEKGYKFPLPFGVMFNALSVKQIMQLQNVSVGFGSHSDGGDPVMYNLDGIAKFNPIETTTSTYNVRVDAWPFPFLDVYLMYGQVQKANVNISMTAPFPLNVTTDVAGKYFGYGAMLNGKIGPMFISWDANQSKNKNPRVDKPVTITTSSIRTGSIFSFQKNKDMKIIFWMGLMYSHFNAATVGSIDAIDLAPNAPEYIQGLIGDMDNWYNNLKPLDKVKYTPIYNVLKNKLTNLENGVSDGYIRYEMDKVTDRPWNMLIGIQWQIDDHWQMRTEAQVLGDRTAYLFSFNYRFGIKGKTWFSH